MNFSKFVSLLDKNALFFCRGRILRKSDSREGSLPKQNFSRTGAERLVKIYGGIAVDFKENQVDQFLKTHLLIAENMADSVFINCWNASLYENPALWKLYGTEENSVAIQSTVGHLKKCFGPFVDYDILVGKIFYIDYDLEEIDEKNYFNLFLNKRKEFEYENEFRCIFFDDGDNSLIEEDQPYDPFSPNPEGTIKLPGVLVPTSLDILIDKIFVSPTAEDWFLELIKSTLKKYEVGPKEVMRSGL